MSQHERIKYLLELKKKIENIDSFHHVKILYIFNKHNIAYSENRNGIFVNITKINENVIQEINDVLLYIKKQEKQLEDVEKIKTNFKSNFFTN